MGPSADQSLRVDDVLVDSIHQRASDVHVKVGNHPIFRVHGDLIPQERYPKVLPDEAHTLAMHMMNPVQQQRFTDLGETEFRYSVPGAGRFRGSAFRERGQTGLVLRVIPDDILGIPIGIRELHLPDVLETLALERRGLILVTGTTGSGKSTTLAAMVDCINARRRANIVTIEDPIEFLHQDKAGIISQREIGMDTRSFDVALRSALRQDPDVILVGEMRDLETISTALMAAETGHLVMSTLHTVDATETINRIITVFPPHQQSQIRIQLAAVIKGIASMRLVPQKDGEGRVPAVEVLVATETIRECLLDPDKTRKIPELIAAGAAQYGMQTFDQSLYDLVTHDLVALEEALKWCTAPQDFLLKIKGIQSTSDLAWMDPSESPAQGRFRKSTTRKT